VGKAIFGFSALVGICGFAAAGFAQSPSPIGLYGHWSSAHFPGAGGDIKLADIVVSADGAFVGRVFFTGSPCAVWGNFSGRLYGDTTMLSMIVGIAVSTRSPCTAKVPAGSALIARNTPTRERSKWSSEPRYVAGTQVFDNTGRRGFS
jgi:hypothetical protein